MSKTKIIATVGPSSSEKDTLKEMIYSGMDVVRLNMTHATHSFCDDIIRKINELNKELDTNVAIMMDLQGPDVCINKLEEGEAELVDGEIVRIYMDDRVGNAKGFSTNYHKLLQEVKYNTTVKIDDGKIELEVIDKEEDIEILIKLLHRKNVGIVAPTILERKTKNRGWKNPTPKQEIVLNLAYIHRFFRKKYLYYDEDYYQGDFSIVDVLSGCFFLIQSKTLQAVNYLDDHVFLYYEENILAKKLQVKKKINLVSNKVTIIHNHSVTIDKSLKRIKKYKAQKKSQYYFEVEYNNASWLERILLKLTAWLSQLILSISYFIQDLLRK